MKFGEVGNMSNGFNDIANARDFHDTNCFESRAENREEEKKTEDQRHVKVSFILLE